MTMRYRAEHMSFRAADHLDLISRSVLGRRRKSATQRQARRAG